jgi:hypothetical protein
MVESSQAWFTAPLVINSLKPRRSPGLTKHKLPPNTKGAKAATADMGDKVEVGLASLPLGSSGSFTRKGNADTLSRLRMG